LQKDKFNCELITWERFDKLSKTVAKRIIESDYIPDMIIGLSRGGWVFSRILCDFIGVKDLLSLKVEHWGITASPDGEAKLKYPLTTDLTDKQILVVDDITDTGESMLKAIEHITSLKPSTIKTATLLHIEGSKFIPDYFAEEIIWRWVIFPWNFIEDMCNIFPKAMQFSKDELDISLTKENLKNNFKININEEIIQEIHRECKRRGIKK
jgi:hypoxanthine phosphoribosyltransferase